MFVLEKDGVTMSVALECQKDAFIQNGWVEKTAQPVIDEKATPKKRTKKVQ